MRLGEVLVIARWREKSLGWLMIAPYLVFVAVFVIGPLVYVAVLSTYRWNLLSPRPVRVGFQNYVYLWNSSVFRESVTNSLLLAIGMFVFSLPLGFFFAVLLNMKLRGTVIYRSILFSSYVVPLTASGLVFTLLLNTHDGLVNRVLEQFGRQPIDWLGSSHYALWSVLMVSVWQYVGYYMLIFLAGLQNVPEALMDSCRVDGGSRWRTLWHVTLPSISPNVFFAIVVCLIQSFQTFDQVYVMTDGGPDNATSTLTYYLFSKGFQMADVGPAAAASVVLLVILALLSLLQMAIGRRWVVDEP
ncbi:MAG: sugar ABC transporter permease [Alicyclobacillus sp.]|nr:sugar ABC transporter permease [Alicyclobacillus sp.]